jgi:hypothetical protein
MMSVASRSECNLMTAVRTHSPSLSKHHHDPVGPVVDVSGYDIVEFKDQRLHERGGWERTVQEPK